MPPRAVAVFAGGAIVAAALVVCVLWVSGGASTNDRTPRELSFEELTGSRFDVIDVDRLRPPHVREVSLPETPDATAVWGATGRDARGHVWVGVSATRNGTSAYLLEFDPARNNWTNHGSVVDQLKRAGLHRSGEGQIKIHSKIVPASDGWLYFASADEEGETEGGALPRWGGHLWRIDPSSGKWQHLFAAPEGLIAVSGVGRYVYALGYWGHVLYQYDTQRGSYRRTEVGSVAGHVSRNFLADARGHAFVPRVRTNAGRPEAELVELDSELREVAATPLEFYFGKGSINGNQGITGIAYLPDGRLVFTTQTGHLYLVEGKPNGPARVKALGWLHPDGQAYATSLFVWGGPNWLAGIASRDSRYQWITYELRTGVSNAAPLDVGQLKKLLLYGSVTRDNQGRAYLVGWAGKDGGSSMRPVVLQVEAVR